MPVIAVPETVRIRPPCSTTNSRLVPSLADRTRTGFTRPVTTLLRVTRRLRTGVGTAAGAASAVLRARSGAAAGAGAPVAVVTGRTPATAVSAAQIARAVRVRGMSHGNPRIGWALLGSNQ